MNKSILLLSLLILVLAACGGQKSYEERMAEQHEGEEPVSNKAWFEPDNPVSGLEVTYATIDGNEISGYMAMPEDTTKEYPGLIVIHEWWGLNENIKMMTRRLASEGYKALAVDIYNGKVAENSSQARQYMSNATSDMSKVTENLTSAYDYLVNQEGVNNVGTIGWCFGGGMSLQAALALPEQIDATVIYYGRLVQDEDQLAKLDMPILGIFGAEDQGIPVSGVRDFESTLQNLDKNVSIHIYEGAGHAFANPSGERYQEEAAKDAWDKTTAFFEEHLK